MALFYEDNMSEITDNICESSVLVNEQLIEYSVKAIESMYNKYSNDNFMVSKIHHYISQQLPSLLLNTYEARQKSLIHKEKSLTQQKLFMNNFLKNGKYFYNPSNERFYMYDGLHYTERREDDILYDIVSTITTSNNPELQNWKHKTKVSVLKRIKDNHIFTTIPESETIQFVISHLYPIIFKTKNDVKYFLTIIGDNLQKQNYNLIHFINPYAKQFLKQINYNSNVRLNQHCTNSFKMKCHDKHYELESKNCRLVPIELNVKNETTWKDFLSNYSLDFFFVACHYSNRYTGSENYLENNCYDDELLEFVHKIKNNTIGQLLESFQKHYLFIGENDIYSCVRNVPQIDYSNETTPFWESSPQESYMKSLNDSKNAEIEHSEIFIAWKNMFYLWKDFLKINKYPPNLYSGQIKTHVISKFSNHYCSASDAFIGIGSSQLPIIQTFLQFWDSTMKESENHDYSLELDEICILFRKWLTQQQYIKSAKKYKYVLNESKIIDILNYYKPDIEVEDSKYIFKYTNTLWDKEIDIITSIQMLKENYDEIYINRDRNYNERSVSILDAYIFYNNSKKKMSNKGLVASKLFFEDYVKNNYTDYLHNDIFKESFFLEAD